MTTTFLQDCDTFYVSLLPDAFVINSYRRCCSLHPKMAPKRPDLVKKQERVKKILDEPAVQEKMKKKVAKKRDRKCIDAIVKAGGDDSHPDVVKFLAKKPKGGEKEVEFVTKPNRVSDKSAKPKSVRSGNPRK